MGIDLSERMIQEAGRRNAAQNISYRVCSKQHHTLTQILMGVIRAGFALEHVEEAQPSKEMMEIDGMKDEMRRPMMLLVRARKTGKMA